MAVDKIFLIKLSYILRNIFQGCHWWLNIFLYHFLYRIIYYRGENSRSFLLNSFNVLKIFDKKDMKRYFSLKPRKFLICASFMNIRKTLSYNSFILLSFNSILNMRTTLHSYEIDNSSQKQKYGNFNAFQNIFQYSLISPYWKYFTVNRISQL